MLKLMMCLKGGDNGRMLPEHERDTADAKVNLDGEQQEVFLSKNNRFKPSYDTKEQAHNDLWDHSLSQLN